MNASPTPTPNRTVLLLLALASVAPRLSRLNGSLWNDETFSTHLHLGMNLQSVAWMAYDTHPPLYNLIMLIWVSAFGDSPVAIRALPLLCSAASVFWMGRLAAFLVGPRGGLLAAALLALSGASVFYAQEARSYSFIILLFLLMAEAFLRYERQCDARALHRFLLLSLLCAMSHVYAFLFVLCFWGLLLLTARTPPAALAIVRATLAQAAAAAPCYFLIVLMIAFTDEHQYLWRGLTATFTPRDAARLLSFYLFGYAGANALPWAHGLAAALFLSGVGVSLRSRPAGSSEACGAGFSPPWLDRLFGGLVGLGLAASLAATAAPWWLPFDRLQGLLGRDKHPDLIAALPGLLHRTGMLYLLGYGALLGAWAAVGRPGRPGPLGRLLQRLPEQPRSPLLQPAQVPVALPLLAIVLVVVISFFRPTFNDRYMLALLPFALLAMAVALWRLASAGWRVALAALLLAGQAASLAAQEDAYALLKPDYKGALEYVSPLGEPVTGTAVWELENLSRYYERRREIPPLTVVSRSEAMKLDRFVVFVPRAYPLDSPHLAELRNVVRERARSSSSFEGLTLYQIGPAR
jgi:hypothetical protein